MRSRNKDGDTSRKHPERVFLARVNEPRTGFETKSLQLHQASNSRERHPANRVQFLFGIMSSGKSGANFESGIMEIDLHNSLDFRLTAPGTNETLLPV